MMSPSCQYPEEKEYGEEFDKLELFVAIFITNVLLNFIDIGVHNTSGVL